MRAGDGPSPDEMKPHPIENVRLAVARITECVGRKRPIEEIKELVRCLVPAFDGWDRE